MGKKNASFEIIKGAYKVIIVLKYEICASYKIFYK